MGPIQTFGELFDMIHRRGRLIVPVFVLGSFLAVMYALSLPHQYASSEVIQIEQPRIAVELLQSPDESSAARRLQLIEQQLMAREAVLEIITKFGLYTDMPALTDGEKVVMFRESIVIDGIAAAREGGFDDGTIAALTITATLGKPDLAQAVARELSKRTIELSAQVRYAKTQATLDFFMAEEAALADVISSLEQEITGVRSQNVGLTTGRAEAQQAEIGAVNAAILRVESTKISVQRDLDLVDRSSTRPATQRRINELTQQIETLDEQLLFLQNRLTGLEQQLQNTPQAEGKISLLSRRLEQYQTQLEAISVRRTDAEISHRLEQNRQAERLTILEPASFPDFPIGPGRKKYALAGVMGSLMLGLVLAYLLEVLNPVIRTSEQLQRELGITAAVTIPLYQPKPVSRGLFAGVGKLAARLLQRIFRVRAAKPRQKIKVAV